MVVTMTMLGQKTTGDGDVDFRMKHFDDDVNLDRPITMVFNDEPHYARADCVIVIYIIEHRPYHTSSISVCTVSRI